eukprot:superscaffoldBa00003958_g18021
MASGGPPVEEHLLARVRRWFNHYAGGLFWPSNNSAEHPDAERPSEEDRVIDNPPLPSRDQEEEEEIDVVGLYEEDGLQAAEDEVQLGPDDGGGDRDDGRDEDGNAGPPSPPLQQFPPPRFGMDLQQWAPAFPILAPLAVHPAVPFADPFAGGDLIHPAPQPAPQPAPHPFLYPFAGVAWHQQERPDEEEEPEIDVVGLDEEDGIEIPELEVFGLGYVENIGPLFLQESDEDDDICSCASCLEEAPSTSGLGSSRRRSREESDEEEAPAKRLRWSDESDED